MPDNLPPNFVPREFAHFLYLPVSVPNQSGEHNVGKGLEDESYKENVGAKLRIAFLRLKTTTTSLEATRRVNACRHEVKRRKTYLHKEGNNIADDENSRYDSRPQKRIFSTNALLEETSVDNVVESKKCGGGTDLEKLHADE